MILFKIGNKSGFVLVMVMTFMALMVMGTVSLSTMVQQDLSLVSKVTGSDPARFLAEAGINHALADIKLNGFASRSSINGSLSTGSYAVTYSQSGSRHLITSVGTSNGMTETVTAEVADSTPTALNYFSGAGNDIKINSFVADADIIGDLHANNNVELKSGPFIAWLTVTGNVSACGIVKEGTRYHTGSWDFFDNHVVINGDADDSAVVFEGADRITFPTFDYSNMQQIASDSGDYYSSSQVFNSTTLSPGNGLVYVDGDVEFRGTCTINGGIVANNIDVIGTLNQNVSGTRNVIIAKNGNVRIFGRLYTEECLVYASQDIASVQILADIEINGIMLARRDIDFWNFITTIDYNYVYMSPSDLLGEDGDDTFDLVSWNK